MSTQFDELQALAEIDPAPGPDPQAHTTAQAQHLLTRIIRSADGPAAVDHPRQRPRTRKAWLLVPAAAAAVAALVAVPLFGADRAYSSWTPTPTSLPAAATAAAADDCQHRWEEVGSAPDTPVDVRSAGVELAEKRGEYTYLVLATDTHTMDCLSRSGGDEEHLSGSLFDHSGFDAPPADGLAAASVSVIDRDGVRLLFFNARVGADVEGAVAHVPGVGDVEATVTGGLVAAWAPELTPEEARQGIGVTLSLTDGRTVEISPAELRESQTAD